jgi:hypothetical protein
MEAGSASSLAVPAIAFKAPLPPPTNLNVHRIDNIHAPPHDDTGLFVTSWVHDDSFNDLHLDITLMSQFIHSPSDSLSSSTPATQLSFDDSQSSASSSRVSLSSVSPLGIDDVLFVDLFTTNLAPAEYFDGSLLANPFVEVKTEQAYFVPSFDDPLEFATMSLEYKHTEPMLHRSIEVPSSPQLAMPTFTSLVSYERTIPEPSVRAFEHPSASYVSSYADSLSSEDAPSDPALPPPSPRPKKPARVSKQDKGIKCDHCGVDKTPLWRKVPNKENAYHWYVPSHTKTKRQ